MTRRQRFLDGVSLGYVHLVLVTVVGLWLTPFLLGHVGQVDLGLWLLATQILGYVALADIGVAALLPREVAFATGRQDAAAVEDLRSLVSRVRWIMRRQAPIVGVLALAIWWLLPDSWDRLRLPLAVVLAAYVALFPARLYQNLLQGLQELRFLGQVQVLAWAATTALTVALVIAGWGLSALVAGWVVMQVATVVACMTRVRTHHRRLWTSAPLERPWASARSYLGQAGWVSVSQVAQVLMSGTDVLVIGAVLGPAAVVPYSCTGKLIAVLANHPQLLMQSAAPMLSELRASGNRSRLGDVSFALARGMLLVSGAVACAVLVVNEGFVSWWVGPELFGGAALTLLFVAAMIVRHWNTTLVYSLFCFGHERRLSLTTVGDGAVTVAVAAVLVSWLGPIGAPLGSLAGALLVSLPLNARGLARELGVSPTTLMVQQSPVAVRLVLLTVAATAVSQFVRPTWPQIVAGALVIGVLYAAVMAPLLFKPPLAEYVSWWWRRFAMGGKASDPQVLLDERAR